MPNNDVEAAIRLAQESGQPFKLGELEYYVPQTRMVLDLERWAPAPTAVRGRVRVFDSASFSWYFNLFRGVSSAIYANARKPAIIGVIDGASAVQCAWEGHRVELMFQPTAQWLAWKENDRKAMPQATFAEFIEDNMADIATPVGADVLEMVTNLTASAGLTFKSSIRLDSGEVGFTADQTLSSKTGTSNQLTLPRRFTLELRVYEGMPPVKFQARLRWRISEGKLSFLYVLDRVNDIVASVAAQAIQEIATGCNVTIVLGDAPEFRARADIWSRTHRRRDEDDD